MMYIEDTRSELLFWLVRDDINQLVDSSEHIADTGISNC